VSPGQGVYIQCIKKTEIIGYLTKYLSKEGDSPEYTLEISAGLKSVRLYQFFGDWSLFGPMFRKNSCRCPKCSSSIFFIRPYPIVHLSPDQYREYRTAMLSYYQRVGPDETLGPQEAVFYAAPY
jgi:hypothetical protein